MSCNKIKYVELKSNYQTFDANGNPTVPPKDSPFYTIPDLDKGVYTKDTLKGCCPCPEVVAFNPKCSVPVLTTFIDTINIDDCFMDICELTNLKRREVAALEGILASQPKPTPAPTPTPTPTPAPTNQTP